MVSGFRDGILTHHRIVVVMFVHPVLTIVTTEAAFFFAGFLASNVLYVQQVEMLL